MPTQKVASTHAFNNFLRTNLKWFPQREIPVTDTDTELLVNNEDEIDRCLVHHLLLKLAFNCDYTAPIDELLKAGGVTVLDVGCASAFWTMELAAQYPNSHFTGIDKDPYVLPNSTMPKNSDFEVVDVTKPLLYPDGTFDFIFIRSMFTSIGNSEWDATLAELVRVLKPGGYIECVEGYPAVHNRGPMMIRLQMAMKEAFQKTGFMEDVMHTMITRLQDIPQLTDITIRDVDVPLSSRKGEMGKLMQENWSHGVPNIRKYVLATKVMQEAEIKEVTSNLIEEFDEYESYQQFYSVVAKKT